MSHDGKEIYIDVETIEIEDRITSIMMWLNDSFKDYSKAIDLSERLSQISNRETLTVTALSLDLNSFEGLVFLEFEDNSEDEPVPNLDCVNCSNPKLVILTNFNKFYKCIADELNKINLNDCISLTQNGNCCNPPTLDKVIFMNLIIESIKLNLSVGRYNVAVLQMNKLNKLCRNCMNLLNNNNSTGHCTTCN